MAIRDEVRIVLGGEAGQGLQTIETILTGALRSSGLHVFATREYMSRVRGGSNSVSIRASTRPLRAYAERIDFGILLDRKAWAWLQPRLDDHTRLIGDPEVVGAIDGLLALPLQNLALQAGDRILANIVACGFLFGLLGLPDEPLQDLLRATFGTRGEETLAQNLAAARLGREQVAGISPPAQEFRLAAAPPDTERLFLNGSQAVGLGALAGGCNFIASYPMSPSTGVLTFLSRQAARFGIVVEQAEDEIAAINMALGSWYAGGRALVTTSGGGFALMTEGLSLAGAMESPLVVHLAQRPGPATGLPTRTEQGDLELALYAGHGEFPRLLLAPGTIEEAFLCTRHAFDLADAWQVPVIILTDQYLLDSSHDLDLLPLPATPAQPCVVPTTRGYCRYAAAENGVSPRGIPGQGEGLVCTDSDEHDEEGLITESATIRTRMVEKRLKKLEPLRAGQLFAPQRHGPERATRLLVGWGSTTPVIAEALARVGDPATALLHTPQIYPLTEPFKEQLRAARRLIVIENNATAQFARLIQRETGRTADASWLQYDGRPFCVEQVEALIRKEVGA